VVVNCDADGRMGRSLVEKVWPEVGVKKNLLNADTGASMPHRRWFKMVMAVYPGQALWDFRVEMLEKTRSEDEAIDGHSLAISIEILGLTT